MLDIIIDTLVDCVKLIPFLFVAYLLIEMIEHNAGGKAAELVNKSGRFGPVIGAALGVVPQCGFSAVMSNFYAGGIITKGTLIAVFLSTSDEMLPVMLSENVNMGLILKILAAKVVAAIIAGTVIDLVLKKVHAEKTSADGDICRDADCHCENGIVKSAIHHTLEIAAFVLVVSFVLNVTVEYVGEERLSSFILNKPFIGPALSGIIGLIPNCAASVVITELYIQGGMSAGAMLSGLFVGAGVGLLVLFRMNRSIKDNLMITALLYTSGVLFGIIAGYLPVF